MLSEKWIDNAKTLHRSKTLQIQHHRYPNISLRCIATVQCQHFTISITTYNIHTAYIKQVSLGYINTCCFTNPPKHKTRDQKAAFARAIAVQYSNTNTSTYQTVQMAKWIECLLMEQQTNGSMRFRVGSNQ